MRFLFAALPFVVASYLILGWRFARSAWACDCNPGFPVAFWDAALVFVLILIFAAISAWR